MLYPFMTLPDETEIVHSEMYSDGRVKVYIETPDERDGFHHAVCFLPDYEWTDISGYTDQQMQRFRELVQKNAHLIIEYSKHGGVLNAAAI